MFCANQQAYVQALPLYDTPLILCDIGGTIRFEHVIPVLVDKKK